MKPFVYMVIDKGEQGFTLLSMLMVIAILFTTLPLLAYLVNATTYTSNYDEISIQHFFHFLRDEFMLATDYSVTKSKIVFYDGDGKKVSFERYQNVVLRKVDGLGHDIYLRDVKEINFKGLSYGIQAEIISLEGEAYEKTIIYYGK